jgi:hypothetical protein
LNRSGLVLIGFAVAILGYAVVYSGVSDLNPCITPDGVPLGVFGALTTGATSLAPVIPTPRPKVKK